MPTPDVRLIVILDDATRHEGERAEIRLHLDE